MRKRMIMSGKTSSRSDESFRLYKHERSVFSFDDYGALISEIRRVAAKKVLEFGPGISTLALVEAGCSEITTLEYQARWMAIAKDRLRFYPKVHLMPYENTAEIKVPTLDEKSFDLIFVDSPIGSDLPTASRIAGQENCSRLNTVLWSIARAPIVLLHDAKRPGEGRTLARIVGKVSHIEMINTAKGIARITC